MVDYVSIPDRRLAQNFTLYEFLRSKEAAKHGIDNTPDIHEVENLRRTAGVLQDWRDGLSRLFGPVRIILTSGFRSEALNRAVGGSENSDHRRGLAADFYVEVLADDAWQVLDPLKVIKAARASGFRYDQIIQYPGQPRIHVGFGPRMRREIRHSDGQGGYPKGLAP